MGPPENWQRVSVNGREIPRYTFPVYEENPFHPSPSAAAERRGSNPKMSRNRKPDLNKCDIVEIDDDGNEIDEKVIERAVEEETPTLAPIPPLVDNPYYVPPVGVRERKRSVRNDEHLKGKISEVRRHINSARVSARHSPGKAEAMARRISELEASVEKLQSQFSGIDLNDSKYYGGVAIPPPMGLYDMPSPERTAGGSSTRRLPTRKTARGEPRLPVGTTWRVNMRDGSRFLACSSCRNPVSLGCAHDCRGPPPRVPKSFVTMQK